MAGGNAYSGLNVTERPRAGEEWNGKCMQWLWRLPLEHSKTIWDLFCKGDHVAKGLRSTNFHNKLNYVLWEKEWDILLVVGICKEQSWRNSGSLETVEPSVQPSSLKSISIWMIVYILKTFLCLTHHQIVSSDTEHYSWPRAQSSHQTNYRFES